MTGWDDDTLMVMFHCGLKDNVKDKLTFNGVKVTTLDELISCVIDIDDRLFECMMEKHHDGGGSHPRWHVGNHKRMTNNCPATDPYGYVPMELDTLHSTKQCGKGPPTRQGKGGKHLHATHVENQDTW